MGKAMTVEQYKVFKTQPYERRTHEDCNAADNLIKFVALDNLRLALEARGVELCIQKWMLLCARLHYGSVETDELLIDLNCYPEWM